MTLVIIIVAIALVLGAAWFAVRQRAARRDHEAIYDAAARVLYGRYLRDVDALTQAYLLRALSDGEWLAGIKATGLDAVRKFSQAKEAEGITRTDALMLDAERDRTAWHREVARALAEADAPSDRVARQLRAVSESGGSTEPMDEWMLTWLARTADQLVCQAPQMAAELLGWAVASSPAGSAQYVLLASRLADALYRVGDRAAAELVANRALEHAVGSDLLVDLLWTLTQCRMLEGKSAESLATLERALASPRLSPRHRARLLTLAARTHLNFGEAEKADQVAARALEAATEADDNWARGWTLLVMALETSIQGRMTGALPLYDQALEVTQADPALADLRLLLQINKAITLGCLDRYKEALTEARQARDLADRVGKTHRAAQAHGALAQLFFQTGRWDDALAEVRILPEDLKEPGAACCERGIAAVISFHRGDAVAARRHLAAAVPYARQLGHRVIGPLVLARSLDCEHDGELHEALAVLTRAFDGGTEELEEIEDLLADAVRLATAIGDPSAAQDFAGHAIALAAGPKIPHRQANALYCRALLDHDASRLLAAAGQYNDAGRPPQEAKALEAAAREFAATGDLRQARDAFTRAVEVYDFLGAAADVARLRAAVWARSIRRGRRAQHRRARSGWDSLTPAGINVAGFPDESNPDLVGKLLSRATHVSHGLLQN